MTDQFDVADDLSNVVAGTPITLTPISPNTHYNTDYILMYYDALAGYEIKTTPDRLNNTEFIMFLNSLVKFVKTLHEKRMAATPDTDYVPATPSFLADVVPRMNGLTPAQETQLRSELLKYNTTSVIFTGTAPLVAYATTSFTIPPKTLTALKTIETYWNAFENFKNSPRATIDRDKQKLGIMEASKSFSDAAAKIHEIVKYDKYSDSIVMIEALMDQTAIKVNQILEGSFAESETLISMPNPMTHYHDMKFDETDIKIDFTTDSDFAKKTSVSGSSSSGSAPSMPVMTMKSLAAAISGSSPPPPQVQLKSHINTMAVTSSSFSGNVIAHDPTLLDIMHSTIYRDDNGNPIMEYLDLKGRGTNMVRAKYQKMRDIAYLAYNEPHKIKSNKVDGIFDSAVPTGTLRYPGATAVGADKFFFRTASTNTLESYYPIHATEGFHIENKDNVLYKVIDKKAVITQYGGGLPDLIAAVEKDMTELSKITEMVKESQEAVDKFKSETDKNTNSVLDMLETQTTFLNTILSGIYVDTANLLSHNVTTKTAADDIKNKIKNYNKTLKDALDDLSKFPKIALSAGDDLATKIADGTITMPIAKNLLMKMGFGNGTFDYGDNKGLSNMFLTNLYLGLEKDGSGDEDIRKKLEIAYAPTSHDTPRSNQSVTTIEESAKKLYRDVSETNKRLNEYAKAVLNGSLGIEELKNAGGGIVFSMIGNLHMYANGIITMAHAYNTIVTERIKIARLESKLPRLISEIKDDIDFKLKTTDNNIDQYKKQHTILSAVPHDTKFLRAFDGENYLAHHKKNLKNGLQLVKNGITINKYNDDMFNKFLDIQKLVSKYNDAYVYYHMATHKHGTGCKSAKLFFTDYRGTIYDKVIDYYSSICKLKLDKCDNEFMKYIKDGFDEAKIVSVGTVIIYANLLARKTITDKFKISGIMSQFFDAVKKIPVAVAVTFPMALFDASDYLDNKYLAILELIDTLKTQCAYLNSIKDAAQTTHIANITLAVDAARATLDHVTKTCSDIVYTNAITGIKKAVEGFGVNNTKHINMKYSENIKKIMTQIYTSINPANPTLGGTAAIIGKEFKRTVMSMIRAYVESVHDLYKYMHEIATQNSGTYDTGKKNEIETSLKVISGELARANLIEYTYDSVVDDFGDNTTNGAPAKTISNKISVPFSWAKSFSMHPFSKGTVAYIQQMLSGTAPFHYSFVVKYINHFVRHNNLVAEYIKATGKSFDYTNDMKFPAFSLLFDKSHRIYKYANTNDIELNNDNKIRVVVADPFGLLNISMTLTNEYLSIIDPNVDMWRTTSLKITLESIQQDNKLLHTVILAFEVLQMANKCREGIVAYMTGGYTTSIGAAITPAARRDVINCITQLAEIDATIRQYHDNHLVMLMLKKPETYRAIIDAVKHLPNTSINELGWAMYYIDRHTATIGSYCHAFYLKFIEYNRGNGFLKKMADGYKTSPVYDLINKLNANENNVIDNIKTQAVGAQPLVKYTFDFLRGQFGHIQSAKTSVTPTAVTPMVNKSDKIWTNVNDKITSEMIMFSVPYYSAASPNTKIYYDRLNDALAEFYVLRYLLLSVEGEYDESFIVGGGHFGVTCSEMILQQDPAIEVVVKVRTRVSNSLNIRMNQLKAMLADHHKNAELVTQIDDFKILINGILDDSAKWPNNWPANPTNNTTTTYIASSDVDIANAIGLSVGPALAFNGKYSNKAPADVYNWTVAVGKYHDNNNKLKGQDLVKMLNLYFYHELMNDTDGIASKKLVTVLDKIRDALNNISDTNVTTYVKDLLNPNDHKLKCFGYYDSGSDSKYKELYDVSVNMSGATSTTDINLALINRIHTDEHPSNILDKQTKIDRQRLFRKLHQSYSDIVTNNEPNTFSDLVDKMKNYQKDLINKKHETFKMTNKYKQIARDGYTDFKNLLKLADTSIFTHHVKEYPLVKNDKMTELVQATLALRNTADKMHSNTLISMERTATMYEIADNQNVAYMAFMAAVGKKIGTETLVDEQMNYINMSFGVIEYYLGIINTIIGCIEDKKNNIDDMHVIIKKFYINYYIVLNRCSKLFEWINDYKKRALERERVEMLADPTWTQKNKRILEKKIQIIKCKGIVQSIFSEFNSIRPLLDDYQSTFMPKVTLHLRVNDYINVKAPPPNDLHIFRGNNLNWKNYDPTDAGYKNAPNIFTNNAPNQNLLEINMENIYTTDDLAEVKKKYHKVAKAVDDNKGIQFERIYNSFDYPDNSIISNYMALAANIQKFKGTAIMTYGYSGVGKTATLFGSNDGVVKKQGLLQETINAFDDPQIYLRVFEIYGLGTPYDFYWNPKYGVHNKPAGSGALDTDYIAFPDIFQVVIHHKLERAGGDLMSKDYVDGPGSGSVIFQNKYDIYSYIMDMQYPDNCDILKQKKFAKLKIGDRDITLAGNAAPIGPGDDRLSFPTYYKITKDDISNFSAFIEGYIDKKRAKGVKLGYYKKFLARQENPTVNNPKSSRSILVYDFQFKLKHPSGQEIFVPLLIYDLPGKEDIYKTFITPHPGDTNLNTDQQKRTFNDIDVNPRVSQRDSAQCNIECKDGKSSLVMNPLLAVMDVPNASFNNIVIGLHNLINGKPIEARLVQAVLDQTIRPYYASPGTYALKSDGVFSIKVKDLYGNILSTNASTAVPRYPINTTIADLFNVANLVGDGSPLTNYDSSGMMPHTAHTSVQYRTGIAEYASIANTDPHYLVPLKKHIFIVVIKELIRFKLFDVLFEIISNVVDKLPGPHPKGTHPDNGWALDDTREKDKPGNRVNCIYEGFYINENVLGIIDYLCKLVSEDARVSGAEHTDESEVITKNFRYASKYGLYYAERSNTNVVFGDKTDIYAIDPTLLETTDRKLKEDIDAFDKVYLKDAKKHYVWGPADGYAGQLQYLHVYEALRFERLLLNKGSYDSNKIFRDSSIQIKENHTEVKRTGRSAKDPGKDTSLTNYPFIYDFIEPYASKIDMYYMLFVVTNNDKIKKSEEQVKLIENSMDFIKLLASDTKKKTCAQ